MIHSSGLCSPRYWNDRICIFDQNSGQLVGFKLRFSRSLASELVLLARTTRPVDVLEAKRDMERHKIRNATQRPSIDPRW